MKKPLLKLCYFDDVLELAVADDERKGGGTALLM
jgi:hypothetical protein